MKRSLLLSTLLLILISGSAFALPVSQQELNSSIKAYYLNPSLQLLISDVPELQNLPDPLKNQLQSPNLDVMQSLYLVFREALEQTREDVSRWLEVINAQNEVDDALSAFLQDLANDTDLSEDKKSKAVELFPYLLFLANSDSITVLVENETAESLQGVNSFLTGKGVGLSFEPAPVPEPATMILLASGLVGLVGLRKTFRK